MLKVLLFSGTTEGRKIKDYLASCGVEVVTFVATNYGEAVFNYADVHAGRLNKAEMCDVFKSYKADNIELVVIDATHPYATVVSDNLSFACKQSDIEYIRFLRKSTSADDCVSCEDTNSVIEYLNKCSGNVLLTVGSKELESYQKVYGYNHRLYPRVLAAIDVLEKCISLGFDRKNIICMQGPFSKEFNIALLKQIGAKYLVTKDAGTEGGFTEKVEACKECAVKVIVIKRPSVEEGFSFDELKTMLENKYNVIAKLERYFPLFIDIKSALIIGGGAVAKRRSEVLYKFGVDITIIAPCTDIISNEKIKVVRREFIDTDVTDSYDIIIVATDNRLINKRVGELAKSLKLLVNVADNRNESDFYFPAIIESDDIVGGIVSKSGDKHHLVKAWADKLREYLNN